MTNDKGMNMLQNWFIVTEGLMALYAVDTELYEWLTIETRKWAILAEALVNVRVFMKNHDM